MRESATKNSKAIGQMKAHTVGPVIELGEEWSKVYANDTVGYCITAALEIKEVTKEEYEALIP